MSFYNYNIYFLKDTTTKSFFNSFKTNLKGVAVFKITIVDLKSTVNILRLLINIYGPNSDTFLCKLNDKWRNRLITQYIIHVIWGWFQSSNGQRFRLDDLKEFKLPKCENRSLISIETLSLADIIEKMLRA